MARIDIPKELAEKLQDMKSDGRLKALGISMIYAGECGYCGEEIEGASGEEFTKAMEKHHKVCKGKKFIEQFKPTATGKEIIELYRLKELLMKGKASQEDGIRFIELFEKVVKGEKDGK